MFQGKVKFLVTGTEMDQGGWTTWDAAADSVAGLLRASGYCKSFEEIRSELRNGGVIHYGTRDYWVQEQA